MGTTAAKLAKTLESKEAIRQAINAKGVIVTESDLFSVYADKIGQIITNPPVLEIIVKPTITHASYVSGTSDVFTNLTENSLIGNSTNQIAYNSMWLSWNDLEITGLNGTSSLRLYKADLVHNVNAVRGYCLEETISGAINEISMKVNTIGNSLLVGYELPEDFIPTKAYTIIFLNIGSTSMQTPQMFFTITDMFTIFKNT